MRAVHLDQAVLTGAVADAHTRWPASFDDLALRTPPVSVVTHQQRDPWERPGGTTFHSVNDGIEPALDQARDATGDRDVRIAGGSETVLEYLNAGLVDQLTSALADDPGNLQHLLKVVGGLRMPALQPVEVAEAGQRERVQLASTVAGG